MRHMLARWVFYALTPWPGLHSRVAERLDAYLTGNERRNP